jgi:hypothetical protein
MSPSSPAWVTDRILAFLDQIGIPVRPCELPGHTFLPGVRIERGALLFDAGRMAHPGDLLHEAGHIAVAAPGARSALDGDIAADPGEEMMVTAWSYAAALHMEIDPALVFDPSGYVGYGDTLVENFRAGRYLAVPLLQWAGMTLDVERARAEAARPYPHMLRWLRE